jgi:Zn-dependent protease
MKWSLKLGKLLGIDIYLHFTFLLLLAFLGFSYWQATQNVAATLQGVAFIVALFGCVVLHELGHALMARRYGIKTRDITLLPIGGIARLEQMPEKPMQELWVALAGPAVNVAIAAVLFVGLAATGGLTSLEGISVTGGSFWQRLMGLNIFLVAFNLLPAFPMDGGRVLRALLFTRLGRRRATAIAANVGQGMAILLGIVGFLRDPVLIFIAIFVYLGAQAEAGSVEMQSALEGLRVRDAMMTRFRTLAAQDPLAKAVQELLAGSQQDFPVLENDQPVGILRRNDLVKALAEGRREALVAEAMCRDCATVDEAAPLKPAVESMHARQCAAVPVVAGGRLVGLLTLENISEMIMVNAAMEIRRDPPLTTNPTPTHGVVVSLRAGDEQTVPHRAPRDRILAADCGRSRDGFRCGGH